MVSQLIRRFLFRIWRPWHSTLPIDNWINVGWVDDQENTYSANGCKVLEVKVSLPEVTSRIHLVLTRGTW